MLVLTLLLERQAHPCACVQVIGVIAASLEYGAYDRYVFTYGELT